MRRACLISMQACEDFERYLLKLTEMAAANPFFADKSLWDFLA